MQKLIVLGSQIGQSLPRVTTPEQELQQQAAKMLGRPAQPRASQSKLVRFNRSKCKDRSKCKAAEVKGGKDMKRWKVLKTWKSLKKSYVQYHSVNHSVILSIFLVVKLDWGCSSCSNPCCHTLLPANVSSPKKKCILYIYMYLYIFISYRILQIQVILVLENLLNDFDFPSSSLCRAMDGQRCWEKLKLEKNIEDWIWQSWNMDRKIDSRSLPSETPVPPVPRLFFTQGLVQWLVLKSR